MSEERETPTAAEDLQEPEESSPPTGEELLPGQSPFAHPTWALPLVLVMSVPFSVLGLFGHPVWLLLGAPFILVLLVWIYVRVVGPRRDEGRAVDEKPGDDA